MDDAPILITGGGGLLANALCAALHLRGHECIALPRARCDIGSPESLRGSLRRYRPRVIINCAGYTNPDLCEFSSDRARRINAEAVGLLAAESEQYGSRIVHISCDSIYAGAGMRPVKEGDFPLPISAYGRSKLLGEQILRRHDQSRWMIVRTGWLFGDGRCFANSVIRLAEIQGTVKAISDQTGSPSYAPDVAHAIMDLLELEETGVWHVANEGSATWYDLAVAVLEQTASNARILPVKSDVWSQLHPGSAARPGYSVLDCGAYAQRVGVRMRHWRSALGEYSAHLRLQLMAES
jgi:dTDP-4-dehydrorhamnose reductase